MTIRRSLAALVAGTAALAWCSNASAYRPFEGTDAAVADPRQVEIEFGPASYLRDGSERTLFAPEVVFNYGLAPGWEFVAEGAAAHHLAGGPGGSGLQGAGAFLKVMLRDGALQDKTGPSIATEFGALLPGIREDHGAGASLAMIGSQRWPWVTVHLNVAGSLTRQQHADLFLDAIVEGPHDWALRPVGEIFQNTEFAGATTRSALVGAIWQAADDLAFDIGLRGARAGRHTAGEIRAGMTFAFKPP